MSDKQTAAMLDKKLDEKTAHTMFVCGIVMVVAERRPASAGKQ